MCMQLRIIYNRYGNENIRIAMETIANRKEQWTTSNESVSCLFAADQK